MSKRIEITIDLETGEEKIEAHGYPGQTCSLDLANVQRAIGAKRAGRETIKNEQTTATRQRAGR